MKLFLFFAAVYGAAASLAVLGFGAWFRSAGVWLDRGLFKTRWVVAIPEEQRGGPIRTFVHCPACLSFWIGLAMTFWLLPFAGWSAGDAAERVVHALAATGVTWVVHVVLTKLGQYGL